MKQPTRSLHLFLLISFLVLFCLTPPNLRAQDYVTGAFEGHVNDSVTGAPVAGAIVQIINQETGVPVAKQTDSQGRFRQGLLPPGDYIIRVSKAGYANYERVQSLPALRPTAVVPVPVRLIPEKAAAATPTPEPGPTPVSPAPPSTSPQPKSTPSGTTVTREGGILAEINTIDAQRAGAFTENEVATLPLGTTTLSRTFDELGLWLPGVASPPQTQGGAAGPGVGPGVGSAGQFAVNGLRSRANNFTVDGSDNNDEDIGVRRQGFFAEVPQPIESIKEFQMITLLAPAEYGRNFGAQVNAISRSGGNATHATIYGFLNASQLNARNFFDTSGANNSTPLKSGNKPVLIDGRPAVVQPFSGGKDSFTLGQGGIVMGGPLVPNKMFYFLSLEGQLLNANQQTHFAVPTIRQRGAFNSGDSGISVNPLTGAPTFAFPTSAEGDTVFSYYPFPNNPNGPYGANTYTQVLSREGQSKIASAKIDSNFRAFGRQHSLTTRYNFTQDWRDIPAVGGAIFARLRPRVRTQNFSTFLNSELSDPHSTSPILNQVRLSYGRTRLIFDEGRDPGLLPLSRRFTNPADAQFLLNRVRLENDTLPGDTVVSYATNGTTELGDSLGFGSIGPVGQVVIAGFSPVGVDVFNFPQRRVNNTYQAADTLTLRRGSHSFAFGTDDRRTELNSNLPANARPLITFGGTPRLIATVDPMGNFTFRFAGPADPNPFVSPQDFAAAGAPSGFFQTLVQSGSDANIHLRYYQLNFFGQDEWHLRPNLSLSYGLRYEYNTPPRELDQRIENTFNSSALSLVQGLRTFIAGRSKIFEPDRLNFAPRVAVAYSAHPFGADRATVIRAGYGIFYDQILGAVVSQSRNVFPTFSTINFGGGCNTGCGNGLAFNIFNPMRTTYFVPGQGQVPIVLPGTLNTLNPAITLSNLVTTTNSFFGNLFGLPGNAFGATLPSDQLKIPRAHQYAATIEQQLTASTVISVGYVGTLGRHLLRFTSPNLGPNYLLAPLAFDGSEVVPSFLGVTVPPGTRFTPAGNLLGGRPVGNVGAVNIFGTTSRSRYDALQVQVRGRFKLLGSFTQYQVSYTFSRSNDDASDVFDLAGSPALPQNSQTLAGEYAPSNFDARHRLAYYTISGPVPFKKRLLQAILGNIQLADTEQFQTGQPFTVNSIFDVNLDGNLTDRLNTTSGIVSTSDRSQPFRLTVGPSTLLAPVGQDGTVARNTLRGGNLWVENIAAVKTIPVSDQVKLVFRAEVFNVFNRANFGIPVRFLEAPGFGKQTNTVTPARRIQFGLKVDF